MRPTFLLNSHLKAVSALISRSENGGLSVGVSVYLVKDFETTHGKITAGTKGFVDFVDDDTGTVWLLLEGVDPALIHWDNLLALVPFETEDVLECLVFGSKEDGGTLGPWKREHNLRHWLTFDINVSLWNKETLGGYIYMPTNGRDFYLL